MGQLRARSGQIFFLILCGTVCVGCVDRRFVVTSNVPGAQISVDGEPLGSAPLDSQYVYTGKREFRANAPGYEPLVEMVKFEPRWFDYPGLDLFAEVFWPFRIEDVRRVHLSLEPAKPIPVDEIKANAENLRARAATLPPSTIPDFQPTPPRTKLDPFLPAGMQKYFPPTGSTPIPPQNPGRFNGR